jgi:hypothetical protein
MAAKTASVRCVDEMGNIGATPFGESNMTRASALVAMLLGSGSPEMGSIGGNGNSQVGRATRSTPEKAMSAARASLDVNGSRSQIKQTKAVRVGIMKVMTVASEMFSHERESAIRVNFSHCGRVK